QLRRQMAGRLAVVRCGLARREHPCGADREAGQRGEGHRLPDGDVRVVRVDLVVATGALPGLADDLVRDDAGKDGRAAADHLPRECSHDEYAFLTTASVEAGGECPAPTLAYPQGCPGDPPAM